MRDSDGYALLDAGDGRRLERFGAFVLDRPAPGATSPRRDPAAWAGASARFDREQGPGPGRWSPPDRLPERWDVRVDDLVLELRPTASGQVGLFPEHRPVARWAATQAAAAAAEEGGAASVLNLFAHTGLVTLHLARAGAAVAHVDASRPAVAWARRNAALSGLDDRPVRWLVEDAARFVAREARRGRRYDGVVLDPPTYGHGPSGAPWSLAAGLAPLLAAIRPLLDGRRGFVACTSHAAGLRPADLASHVRAGLDLADDREVAVHELALDAESGARLAGGWVAFVGPAEGGKGG